MSEVSPVSLRTGSSLSSNPPPRLVRATHQDVADLGLAFVKCRFPFDPLSEILIDNSNPVAGYVEFERVAAILKFNLHVAGRCRNDVRVQPVEFQKSLAHKINRPSYDRGAWRLCIIRVPAGR